ncbi:MAG: hypothetical protein M3Y48_14915 [Actinomycetota bacterium]|nr:hypothetical protein [Actinomycetota bacterium]
MCMLLKWELGLEAANDAIRNGVHNGIFDPSGTLEDTRRDSLELAGS